MENRTRPPRLTSLLLVEERLTEAEYFARRMFSRLPPMAIGYELNAFLSAARSVTFLFQKEFSACEACIEWWKLNRSNLGDDPAARFFLELRNYSQKEGRISIVGASDSAGNTRHMFAGTVESVPIALLNREVADCCLEHLSKLAHLMLRFSDDFFFHACPARALTPEGIVALKIDLDAVEAVLGFPPQVSTNRPETFSTEDRLRLYRRFIDPVDFEEIRRIADYNVVPQLQPESGFGISLGLSIVEHIENSRRDGTPHDVAVRTALGAEVLKMMRNK